MKPNEVLDLLIKYEFPETIKYIKEWERYGELDVNYDKAYNYLKTFGNKYDNYMKDWPLGIKGTQEKINWVKSSAEKLESKPYKLKEDTQNLSSMTSNDIYRSGLDSSNYEKILDALIQKDENRRLDLSCWK